MDQKGNTDTIRRMLFLQEGKQLPKDFTLNESQWRKLTKEIPKVIKKSRELNPAITDTLELREKIQKSLALRFYEIQRAAEQAIQKKKLKSISLEKLRESQEGAFLVITETGSIHYFEITGHHLDYLQCENYDRQSYYNLKLSEQNTSQQHDEEGCEEAISRLQKIRIRITKVGQLEIQKGIKDLSGHVDYKRAFTTTKIQSIFTSQEIGATSQGYGEISEAITQLTTYFIQDLSEVQAQPSESSVRQQQKTAIRPQEESSVRQQQKTAIRTQEESSWRQQQKTLTIPNVPEGEVPLSSFACRTKEKNPSLSSSAQTKFFAKLQQSSNLSETAELSDSFPPPHSPLKTKPSSKK